MVARFDTDRHVPDPGPRRRRPCGRGATSSASRRRGVSAPDSTAPRPDQATRRGRIFARADVRRGPELGLTGAGVVVAAVDWGVDVDSAAFRWPGDPGAGDGDRRAGGTRFLSLWDQRDQRAWGRVRNRTGTAAVHRRAAIDRALRDPRPYERLGLSPGDRRPRRPGRARHPDPGHRGRQRRRTGGRGSRRDADLLFVHLADRNSGGLANFGDSVRLLEAVDFISRTAGPQPCAINISAGRLCGPRDGTTLVERAFDELLAAAPRAVHRRQRAATTTAGARTPAAPSRRGNAVAHGRHRPGRRHPQRGRDLVRRRGRVRGADRAAGLRRRAVPVRLGERADLLVDGRVAGRVYHRRHDPNNGDNHIVAYLDPIGCAGNVDGHPGSPAGRRSGRFHAWIERDDTCRGCQARFAPGRQRARPSPSARSPPATCRWSSAPTTATTRTARSPRSAAPARAGTAARSPTWWRRACACSRPGRPRPAPAATRAAGPRERHQLRGTARRPAPSRCASRRPGGRLQRRRDPRPGPGQLRSGSGRRPGGPARPRLPEHPPAARRRAAGPSTRRPARRREGADHGHRGHHRACWQPRGHSPTGSTCTARAGSSPAGSATGSSWWPGQVSASAGRRSPATCCSRSPWAAPGHGPVRPAGRRRAELVAGQPRLAPGQLLLRPRPRVEMTEPVAGRAGAGRRQPRPGLHAGRGTGRRRVRRGPGAGGGRAAGRRSRAAAALARRDAPGHGADLERHGAARRRGRRRPPARLLVPRPVDAAAGRHRPGERPGLHRSRSTRPSAGRTSPTLLVLPRGNFFGGRSGRGYDFPALHPPGALQANWWTTRWPGSPRRPAASPALGRLILTAHSGGGASLMRILRYADPERGAHLRRALHRPGAADRVGAAPDRPGAAARCASCTGPGEGTAQPA